MTRSRLPPLLVAALLAGVGAAPASDQPGLPATQYKCCRDGRLSNDVFFDAPAKVTTLDLCKTFCQDKNYGSPVFRGGGWGCASTKEFRCNEVDKVFCESGFSGLSGYYRLYALSSLVTTREEVNRRTTGTDSGAVDTRSEDASLRERAILGGTAADALKKRGLTQVDVSVGRSETLGRTTITGQTRNFDGGRSTGLGGGFISLGTSGNGAQITEIIGSNRTRATIERINVVADRNSSSTQNLRGPGGREAFLRSTDGGSETTVGRVNENRRTNQNLTRTSLNVSGTATIDPNALVGDRARVFAGLGDIGRNVQAEVVRGSGSENTSGTGIRDTQRRGDQTNIALTRDEQRALLRRQNTQSLGSTVQKSSTTGRSDTDTDITRIKKDGVGSIEQAKNNTVGRRDNTTATVDVDNKVTTVNTTAECDNCVGVGAEVTRRKDVKDTIVDANSRFNDTTVATSTSAGGKRLDLFGQTRRELNGTLEDTQRQLQQTSDRGGRSQKDCNKKTGVCRLVTDTSGSTTTVSRNTTKTADKVETNKQVVSVSSF